jgi:uncharacterized protein (TIGR03083 family)
MIAALGIDDVLGRRTAVDVHDVFAAATAERLDVAELLESLTAAQLGTASLCVGWDCFTVGAHLAVTVSTTFAVLMAAVIKQRGNVHRANDRLARKMARRPPAEVINILRLSADLQLAPPRTGPMAALTDVLVHAGDIRLPLKLPHDPPPDRVLAALEYLTGPRTFGFARSPALHGLRLIASDVGFDAGSGQEVLGRGADLMMVACGRPSVLSALSGPGVATLRSRFR